MRTKHKTLYEQINQSGDDWLLKDGKIVYVHGLEGHLEHLEEYINDLAGTNEDLEKEKEDMEIRHNESEERANIKISELQDEIAYLQNNIEELKEKIDTLENTEQTMVSAPLIKPATKKQTWALFSLTGHDFRKHKSLNLSITQASAMISAAIQIRKAA